MPKKKPTQPNHKNSQARTSVQHQAPASGEKPGVDEQDDELDELKQKAAVFGDEDSEALAEEPKTNGALSDDELSKEFDRLVEGIPDSIDEEPGRVPPIPSVVEEAEGEQKEDPEDGLAGLAKLFGGGEEAAPKTPDILEPQKKLVEIKEDKAEEKIIPNKLNSRTEQINRATKRTEKLHPSEYLPESQKKGFLDCWDSKLKKRSRKKYPIGREMMDGSVLIRILIKCRRSYNAVYAVTDAVDYDCAPSAPMRQNWGGE